MEPLKKNPKNRRPAFSLIELLVVIAIAGVLVALSTAAFSSIARGSKLTASGRQLQSEISLARQQAVTFHREVEVRIFPTARHGASEWNGLQIFACEGTNDWVPLRRPTVLPEGVTMDTNASTLLKTPPVMGSASFGSYGVQNYKAFRFRAGGNTQPDLTATNNSLKLQNSKQVSPDNFFVIRITPVNGRVTAHQP